MLFVEVLSKVTDVHHKCNLRLQSKTDPLLGPFGYVARKVTNLKYIFKLFVRNLRTNSAIICVWVSAVICVWVSAVICVWVSAIICVWVSAVICVWVSAVICVWVSAVICVWVSAVICAMFPTIILYYMTTINEHEADVNPLSLIFKINNVNISLPPGVVKRLITPHIILYYGIGLFNIIQSAIDRKF